MNRLSITYSVADQCFVKTKSKGILNVSLQLLKSLDESAQVQKLTLLSNPSLKLPNDLSTKVEIRESSLAIGSKLGRIWWDQIGVYRAARKAANEWLILPKGFASFTSRKPGKLATLVHDLMQSHYEQHHPHSDLNLESLYFRKALQASLLYSDIIFTPTDFIRNEVQNFADQKGWSVGPIVTCGEGFSLMLAPSPQKNDDIVVMASPFPHKLTKQTYLYLERWCKKVGFKNNIHFVGSLPPDLDWTPRPEWHLYDHLEEADFTQLVSTSRVLVFSSEYEGFGRPPVEAVLQGVCPVYSNIPASREVMGDCGYSFNNSDFESFAFSLSRAFDSTEEQMAKWAVELRVRHNWTKVGARIIDHLTC